MSPNTALFLSVCLDLARSRAGRYRRRRPSQVYQRGYVSSRPTSLGRLRHSRSRHKRHRGTLRLASGETVIRRRGPTTSHSIGAAGIPNRQGIPSEKRRQGPRSEERKTADGSGEDEVENGPRMEKVQAYRMWLYGVQPQMSKAATVPRKPGAKRARMK
jgi:hypothetical protein